MKKIYFLAVALIAGFALNGQTLNEDFESYPLGPYFGGHWSNWSGIDIPAENIVIASDVSTSGAQSGFIGSNGETDAILVLPMREGGISTVKLNMYIDFGSTAYFNFQKDLTQLGVTGNWANQWYWGIEPYENPEVTYGTAYYTADGNAFTFGYFDGEWINIEMEIDLDNNINKIYIDGEELLFDLGAGPANPPFTETGSALKYNGMDFYSHSEYSENSYFIDDIIVQDGGMSSVVDLEKNSIQIYPTVVRDIVKISAKNPINNIMVYNTAGQSVMKTAANGVNAQLNMSALPAGVYIIKVQAGKETLTQKVVVK